MGIGRAAPTDLESRADSMKLDKKSSSTIQNKTEWTSIYIASTLTFVGAVQFSIYFSSLWPYLQIVSFTVIQFRFFTDF